ncbi:MAG TPA: hypothetical protein EYP40_06540 [Chromatiales bacterium]|nr:hypothetical protein [Chromatiales bacterium]
MRIASAFRIIAVTGFTIPLLGGCFASKFTPTERPNLTPFSDQTIQMVGAVNYNISSDQAVYLRDIASYMGGQRVFDHYVNLERNIINLMKAAVVYSLRVVAISEQEVPEAKKVNALADTIVVLDKNLRVAENLSGTRDGEQFAQDIEKIRHSKSYLEALQNSTRIINDFSQGAGEILDELRNEQNLLANQMDKAIDRKYAESIRFANKLRDLRIDYYKALTLLTDYSQHRDPETLAGLRAIPIHALRYSLRNKQELTIEDINRIQTRLIKQVKILHDNYRVLQPDLDMYYKSLAELYDILQRKDTAIKSARLFFIAWSRAYGRMAAGRTDPAEWFDVTDTGGLLFGAAKSAAGL